VIGTDESVFGELAAEFMAGGQDFIAQEIAGEVEVAVLVQSFVRGGNVACDGNGGCAEVIGSTQFADCPGSVLEDLTPGNEGLGSGVCRGRNLNDLARHASLRSVIMNHHNSLSTIGLISNKYNFFSFLVHNTSLYCT